MYIFIHLYVFIKYRNWIWFWKFPAMGPKRPMSFPFKRAILAILALALAPTFVAVGSVTSTPPGLARRWGSWRLYPLLCMLIWGFP